MKHLSITLIVIVAIFLVGGCSDSEEPLSSFEASITPDAPTTTDDLVVNIVAPEDWGNETITYEYKWYLDGVLQPSLNTNRVPSTQTAKGQTWQAEVTPVKEKAYRSRPCQGQGQLYRERNKLQEGRVEAGRIGSQAR